MPLRTLFAAMRGQRLQYYFGRITNKMDMMLEVFAEHHGEPIKPFDVSDPESIASSVTSSVLSSVSTASASVGSLRLPVALPALSPAMPDWQTIDEHPAVVTKLELPAHVSETSSMAALKKTTVKATLQIARQPFAHGSCRLAFHGRRLHKNGDAKEVEEVVLKEFIKPAADTKLDQARHEVDFEVQTVAAKLALDFNSALKLAGCHTGTKIKYLMAKAAVMAIPDGHRRYVAIEKVFREGRQLVKYTNNFGFCRPTEEAELMELLQAFSHFTWEHTRHFCMVTDLQGVETTDAKGCRMLLLTDPAIHCPGVLRFGNTDLQQPGVDAFLKNHRCSRFCQALVLPASSD